MTTQPDNYRSWNSSQFLSWINSIDPTYTNKYAAILAKSFAQHNITGQQIDDLDMTDLKEYGIINLTDRKKIYAAIQGLIAIHKKRDSLDNKEDQELLSKAIAMSMEYDGNHDTTNVQDIEHKTNQDSNVDDQQAGYIKYLNAVIRRILISIESTNRKKDVKLIQKIFTRIIDNPTDEKYRKLNVEKLSQKLHNYDLWLRLLVGVGFRTSTDGNLLVFDIEYINYLKICHQIIMQYDIDSVPEKQHGVENNPFQTTYDLQIASLFLFNNRGRVPEAMICLCGKSFQTVKNPQTLYDGRGACCNICRNFGSRNQCYYHCADYKNAKHHNGFDICDNCTKILLCNGSVKTCVFFDRLITVMVKYIGQEDEHMDIDSVCNDYLHILEKHNDYTSHNIMYELIISKLGECKMCTCPCLSSLYDVHVYQNADQQNISAKQKILNIIHCYFYHYFDIGLRLTDTDFDSLFDYTNHDIDAIALKMHSLLTNKRNVNQITLNRTRSMNRYNQLVMEQKNNDDFKHQDHAANGKVFHFGFQFAYEKGRYTNGKIEVNPKYSSLKQELIQNQIARLNVQQYNEEFKKASVRLHSQFCKKHYSQPVNNNSINKLAIYFGIDHILSLMVYCNYDNLQYQFSKTYRENDGQDHEQFYHLGKNITCAVTRFGQSMKSDDGISFYHGLNEILHIKHLNSPHDTQSGTAGTTIHCPISTSSSFEVAAHFTADQKGMVIEFGCAEMHLFGSKSFDCAWLSNFPNEKEHLFINSTLQINNIYFMSDGSEYKNILIALTIMLQMVCSYMVMIKAARKHKDSLQSEFMQRLIVAVLHDRLSAIDERRHPKFNSLNIYARQMITNCLESQQLIMIHPLLLNGSTKVGAGLMEEAFSFLYHAFVGAESMCPRLDHIVTIFPNVVFVDIWDIPLCDNLMQRLFQYLTDDIVTNTLEIIRIVPHSSGWQVSKTITKYIGIFANIGYNMVEKRPICTWASIFRMKAPIELEIAKYKSKYCVDRVSTGAGLLLPNK
eukprot:357221_1